jgi:hypothetical protein
VGGGIAANQSLHPTAAAFRFFRFNVSPAAAAGELVRYAADVFAKPSVNPIVSTKKTEDEPLYVVRDGPLKGEMVSIISVEGDRVRAIVSGNDHVTPPIYIARSQLKKIPSAFWLLPRWTQACYVIITVSFLGFLVTYSLLALTVALISIAGCFMHFVRCGIIGRRLKTCPMCNNRLDLDTWSCCEACGWERPHPTFLDSDD